MGRHRLGRADQQLAHQRDSHRGRQQQQHAPLHAPAGALVPVTARPRAEEMLVRAQAEEQAQGVDHDQDDARAQRDPELVLAEVAIVHVLGR